MTTEYEDSVTKITALPKSEPLFSEMATTIEIVSEGAGEPEYDDICASCSGSGEGRYEGGKCYACNGKGVIA